MVGRYFWCSQVAGVVMGYTVISPWCVRFLPHLYIWGNLGAHVLLLLDSLLHMLVHLFALHIGMVS